jgi:hypothetical protein
MNPTYALFVLPHPHRPKLLSRHEDSGRAFTEGYRVADRVQAAEYEAADSDSNNSSLPAVSMSTRAASRSPQGRAGMFPRRPV